MTLEQVLADARGDATVLRRAGHAAQADYLDGLCDRVAVAAEDHLVWLSLAKAEIKSGLSRATLERRFRWALDCGLARWNANREREFLSCAVPPRPDVSEARERGRRAVA